MLTHFSLFSGIGGIDLAAEWAGFTTSVEVSRCIILHKMHVPGSYCPAEGRQADCPLKLVEDKEVE